MQDRYFGDVGDFGKYGLLRSLGGLNEEDKLDLGVVWYLFPDETHNTDGKYIGYLRSNVDEFRDCDASLYDKLRGLLFDESGAIIEANRNIAVAKSSDLLPEGTVFYSQPLFYQKDLSAPERITRRQAWFSVALKESFSADIVFLDPDNGIECKSVKRTSSKGPKYVFWEDIDAFVGRGQSVIIYHHLNRSCSHDAQVETIGQSMTKRWAGRVVPSALTFKRGTNRTYFILASPEHQQLLDRRIQKFLSGPWGRHFSGQAFRCPQSR